MSSNHVHRVQQLFVFIPSNFCSSTIGDGNLVITESQSLIVDPLSWFCLQLDIPYIHITECHSPQLLGIFNLQAPILHSYLWSIHIHGLHATFLKTAHRNTFEISFVAVPVYCLLKKCYFPSSPLQSNRQYFFDIDSWKPPKVRHAPISETL
jgi:hypothetical protein